MKWKDDLPPGKSWLSIRVMAGDGATSLTYRIHLVSRVPARRARLRSLAPITRPPAPTRFQPEFGPYNLHYTLFVPWYVESFTSVAVANDDMASIFAQGYVIEPGISVGGERYRVNGTGLSMRSRTLPEMKLAYAPTINRVSVRVLSVDGMTQFSYEFAIVRAPKPEFAMYPPPAPFPPPTPSPPPPENLVNFAGTTVPPVNFEKELEKARQETAVKVGLPLGVGLAAALVVAICVYFRYKHAVKKVEEAEEEIEKQAEEISEKQRAIDKTMGEFRSNIVANVRLMRNRTFVRAFFGLPMTSKAGAAIGKMRAASAALMLGQSAAKTPRSPGSVSPGPIALATVDEEEGGILIPILCTITMLQNPSTTLV